MSTIVTRAGKGSPLTNTEVDNNFTNLNTDKLEKDGSNLASKISFDTTAALTPATGQMVWDAETGTVDIGLNGATAPVMSVGEDQFYRVINQTGSTITKGTLVMAFGTVGASGVIKVKAWDGSQASKTIMGLVMADIPTENDPTESGLGYILAFGKLKGIQTNGGNYGQTWANGDIIYAGASSGLTNVLPAAPNTKTTVAIVINAHATNGTLFVRPSYGSNLGEDELVQLASLANGDVLSYDSTDGRFENKTLAAAGIYATSNPAGYTTNTGTVTSVGGTGTVNGITLTGTVTSSGNLTLGGTLSGVNLTSQVTGTLPVGNGGTGATTLTGVLKGNGTSAFTAGTVALGSEVSGTLPVANGGTGLTTLTANNVILGNGTSTPSFVAPGTSGNVLTSNGTTWTSAAAGAALSGVTDSASPFLTALGAGAGDANSSVLNTYIGYRSGYTTASGNSNTAIGAFSLANASSIGNAAVGVYALNLLSSGGDNTAVGYYAADVITTGYYNVAIGSNALGATTTANGNVAVGGYNTLLSNTVGANNVAVGQQAMQSNTTGSSNVAIGTTALFANTASNNAAFGHQSGDKITTGQQNVTIGSGAASSGTNDLTTGSNNIIIGYNAEASSATVSNEVTIGNTSITSTRLRGMVELNAAMFEKATISATAATGTINFDARSQSVLYYTSNASGNWTLNIRAASGVSLDSVMTTGSSITLAFMVTNGATAYYQTAFQVDGSSVTPKWQGGTAPAAGNASSIDAYVITVIKTGTATFTALASQTAFA